MYQGGVLIFGDAQEAQPPGESGWQVIMQGGVRVWGLGGMSGPPDTAPLQ